MYLFLLSFHNDYIIDLRDVCVHLLQFAFNFIFYFSRPCLFNINFWMCKTLACFPDSKLYIKLYWDRHHCGKLVIYLKEMWLILLMLKSSLFYSSNYFSLIKHTSQEFKGSKSLLIFAATQVFLYSRKLEAELVHRWGKYQVLCDMPFVSAFVCVSGGLSSLIPYTVVTCLAFFSFSDSFISSPVYSLLVTFWKHLWVMGIKCMHFSRVKLLTKYLFKKA